MKKLKFKFVSMILALSFVFSAAFPTFVLAAEVSEKNQTKVVESNKQVENDPVEIMGWKKSAIVYALKYGGRALDAILDLISPEHARYLTKYADEIADFLDSISNSFEARLIDFMIFELGIPNSSARAIAWAICFVML